jgi:hypothetical protein
MKGDASEEQWRSVLERHLPRRYKVAKGQVVDSRGGCSEQIDVIVHDAHYCPLFSETGGSCFVPAESVYAVFEVKQELTADCVAAAGSKAESVRRLHRTSATILERGKEQPARGIPPVLSGVLALTVAWADGLGQSFWAAVSKLNPDERLDVGCALAAGAFEVIPGGDPKRPIVYPADVALVTFFLRLVHRLQLLGTVPAIDWEAYLQAALPIAGEVQGDAQTDARE